ncbi:MAG: winged helix-turn-helix transcriptional regulator [Candidatus Aenigmatarchaeota archaeon]
MRKKQYSKEIILNILKEHPDGLTIQELSKIAKMSRITATKYVHELIGEGKVVERKIGIARLLFLKERFAELVKEEEILEKLRKKL